MSSISDTDDISGQEMFREQQIMQIAYDRGLKVGIPSFIASAGGVYYFFKTRPNLPKTFGFSAMSGLPLMVGIFGFFLVAEQTMFDAGRNPENYGLAPLPEGKSKKVYSMSPYKIILNQYIDSPVSMLAAVSIPLAIGIGYQQSKLTHLNISNRVLHSRVLAQGGVLSVLMVTMMLQTYMSKRGRFYPDDVSEEDKK